VWTALEKLIAVDASLSEEDRRTFSEERTQYNVRTIRWIFPITALSHLAIAYSGANSVVAPERASTTRVVLILQVALLLSSGTMAIAAWTKRGALARVHPYLGDVAVISYILLGSLVSASTQRIPSLPIQLFLIVSIASALLRPRAPVHLLSMVVGFSIVATGILRFQIDPFSRASNLSTAAACSFLGAAAFLIIDRYRGGDLVARGALARLNGELEKRVADQVGEILKRAKQVEELNVQLAEKVQERSRELSVALARLAGASPDHENVDDGTVLADRVVIEARIGAGGMGTVYRGFDRVTQRKVAVKLVQAASVQELDSLQRFLREAEAMASVSHPAVVKSLHVDVSEDGRLFQIMELVDGKTLSDHLSRGPLIAPVAARVGAVLADALAAAHSAAVVHCDVKPANIMLTAGTPGLRLLDFGISVLRDARAASGVTRGGVLGTPAFMAPEQFAGREGITDRADVYSLGLVVYECLTHRLPYTANTPRDWFVAHVNQKPRELGEVLPELDAELASTVMRCLAKDAAERPAAAEVAATLQSAADRLGAPRLEAVAWEESVRTVAASVREPVAAAVTLRE
jgi:serine/threonine-protein kinase